MWLARFIPREYGIAVLAVVLAIAIRALVDPLLGDHLPYYLFYFAVIAAAVFGGTGPGLIALTIGFLSASYLFATPRYSLGISAGEEALGAFRFISLGAVMVFAGGWGRSVLAKWKLEVSERRRNEAEARHELERTHSTLASIGDGLITTDTTGRVTFMNEVAERLSGWTTASARGREIDHVFRIIHTHTRETVPNPALRALLDGSVMTLPEHTSLVDRHGVERPIADSAAPIRDPANNLIGSVLVFREAAVPDDAFIILSIHLHPADGAQLPLTTAELDLLERTCREWLRREWKPDRRAVRFVSLNGFDLIAREDLTERLPTGAIGVRFRISYQR